MISNSAKPQVRKVAIVQLGNRDVVFTPAPITGQLGPPAMTTVRIRAFQTDAPDSAIFNGFIQEPNSTSSNMLPRCSMEP